MSDVDNNAWFDQAEVVLAEVLGEAGVQQLAADWQAEGTSRMPVVTVFGVYDAGKSSLLKRLLVEAGQMVPSWLTISARRETFEIGEVDAWGCTFRDTPGIAGGNAEHEEIARNALCSADVMLLAVPPQLLTGELKIAMSILSGELFGRLGMPIVGVLKTVICRLDEGSYDPTDDEEGYRGYQASKREEWRALLKQRDIVQPEADVHTVAADPYQLVGNDPSPTLESYGEHYRQWDGINQLIADLRQVPAQLPELRAATRRRFYGLRLKMLLEGMEEQAENLAVQETQTSISRDTIGLREQQLAALLQAARATLDGVIEEELLAAIKAQPPKDAVHDFLAPRMETAIRQWWNEQNAVLNKQMSELNNPVPALSAGPAPKELRGPKEASRQAGGGRNHGVRVDSIFKKMKDLLQDHQEGQIGMSLSKAKEELGKFDGVSSLEEYLKLAGKSGKFKTEEAAEAARDALRLQGWISFVPVVVELGGLIMDVVDNEQRKVELRKRREELRDQVRKQATAIAQTAWEKWQRPAHEFQQLLQQERDQLAQQHMRLNLQLTELQRGSARLRQIL